MTTRPPADIGMPLAEVDTPALLVDLDAFEQNLDTLAQAVTDKPVYHTTDQVRLDNLIRNLTGNLSLDGALLRIRVLDESSQPVFTIDESLGQLLPGSQIERTGLFSLIAAAQGLYEIRSQVIEAGTLVRWPPLLLSLRSG